MNDPDEITPEVAAARERLEAEVERRRRKLETEGRALELEQHDTAIAGEPETIRAIGDIVPEIVESMNRSRERWIAFREETRPAFDAAPDSIGCPDHPAESRQKLFEETCRESKMARTFTVAYAPCQACDGAAARKTQARFWAARGVPKRLIEATLLNFATDTEAHAETLEKVKGWIKSDGVFLILSGPVGTGKSHLGAACMKAHGNGRFITHPDMLSDLRASYTLHNTAEIVAGWKEAEVLVMDEFGLSPGGKDEEPLLYQVLAGRYDARRPTIITSNLDIAALRAAIGPRLLDRITEDCVSIVMKWTSHRTGK